MNFNLKRVTGSKLLEEFMNDSQKKLEILDTWKRSEIFDQEVPFLDSGTAAKQISKGIAKPSSVTTGKTVAISLNPMVGIGGISAGGKRACFNDITSSKGASSTTMIAA